MHSLFSWRDGVVLSVLLAVGGYSLAVGRLHFDGVVPAAIEAGAPRQLARELVGRDLQALPEDDRVRVDHFLTSLAGEGVGSCAEEGEGEFRTMWLKPCVRGRTRWLLAQRCVTQVRLHQFDTDWRFVATTYIDRSTTFIFWHSPNVELVSTPLSPVVVVTADVVGIEPDKDVVQRACFGLDDDGAFVLRYEDEAGHFPVKRMSWAATWNDREEFTPASWLKALTSDDPLHVLSALNRLPQASLGDDAEAADAWQRVANAAQPRLRQLAESLCTWIREAAADLRERLR
jgi:hypothetical protein